MVQVHLEVPRQRFLGDLHVHFPQRDGIPKTSPSIPYPSQILMRREMVHGEMVHGEMARDSRDSRHNRPQMPWLFCWQRSSWMTLSWPCLVMNMKLDWGKKYRGSMIVATAAFRIHSPFPEPDLRQ